MSDKRRYTLNKYHSTRSHRTDSALVRVFDQSQLGVCIITQTGSRILYVNSYFLRLTGYFLESVIGHAIKDFVVLDSLDKNWIHTTILRANGFVKEETVGVRLESGEQINLKVSLDTIEFNHIPCVLLTFLSGNRSDHPDEGEKSNYAQMEEWVKEKSYQFSRLTHSLLETQSKQKALLDNIPDMAWLKDRDGRFIAVNQPFASACGMPVEQVIGKTDLDLWPIDLAIRYRSDDADVVRRGRVKKIEERFKDSSGHETWIETIKAPIFDQNNDVIGITGIARDIYQRKQLEDDRLKFKAELEQIVSIRTRELAVTNENLIAEIEKHRRADKIQAAVYQIAQSTNLSENLTVLFRSIHQILGTMMPVQNFFIALFNPKTEIITFPYFVDEHDSPPVPRKLDHGITDYVLRTGEPLLASPEVFEKLVQQKEVDNIGAPSIDWLGVPLPTKNEIIGVLAIQSYHADIRFGQVEKDILVFVSNQIGLAIDRVRNEERLRESEARYRAVVENQIDLICRFEADGTITFANQALANFYNRPIEEMLGIPYVSLLPQDEQERFRKRFEWMQADRQQSSNEQHMTTVDGETRWISWTDRPLFDRSGNFLEYQSVGHDITAQKLRQREMEAIVTITAALRSARNRSDMAPIILDQLMPMLNATGAALAILDQNLDNLVVEIGRGVWTGAEGNQIGLFESIAGVAIDLGKAYAFPSASGETMLEVFELGETLPAIICVPLVAQDKPMGVIWVGRRLLFNANDLHLITAISDIAANAFHRSELHEQTQKQLMRLTALRAIEMAISASLDLNVTLDILVEQIVNQLGIHAAILLKYMPETQTLKIAAGNGIAEHYLRRVEIKLGESHAGRIALLRQMEIIRDLDPLDDRLTEYLRRSGLVFKSYIGLPLIAKGQIKGVLELYHRDMLDPDAEWLDYLQAIAAQAAIAIDSAEMFVKLQKSNEDLERAYDATIEGWARALEIRDKETEGHARRVVDLTLELADSMGETSIDKDQIRRGVLLHDIGKMAIPDTILLKPGPLDEEEWKIMHLHPGYALELLQPIDYLRKALDIPYCHHEKWDGSGYPRGLKGEQIPLAARIFSVVDVWDALNSNRPYGNAWPREKIIEHIRAQSGHQFDPQVVEAFLAFIQLEGKDSDITQLMAGV